ncbi:hypothetical protein GGR54DRAFT_55085 [Hypoxylon sp. NC1633]|nr:hypothetical protein GGR54DRAFT_55085 [Hypoxylon sp. NC1633]
MKEPFSCLLSFDPTVAGELRIQCQVGMLVTQARSRLLTCAEPKYIHNMTNTQNNEDYERWVFRMSITVAHEVVHFLMGYLNGKARPITPPRVSVEGWPGGEAGRAWERETFEGRYCGVLESERRSPAGGRTHYLQEFSRRCTRLRCIKRLRREFCARRYVRRVATLVTQSTRLML